MKLTDRADKDWYDVEDPLLEDLPGVEARSDGKADDEDDRGAKGRSIAVEPEVNHFTVYHSDLLAAREIRFIIEVNG